MNPWSLYDARRFTQGVSKRQTMYRREYGRLTDKVVDGLSFHTATIDGVERRLSIINSDNLNEKTLLTLPGEDLDCGGIVEWMENHWIITEKDANNELYTRAKMEQCNYLLRWVDPDSKQVIERWCIIEDGTKLKRISPVRNSLAYWKRYVKTISLIAGNPLEPYHQNGIANSYRRVRSKSIGIGQSAAKPRIAEGSTTIPGAGVGTSVSKWETLNRQYRCRHGEDIVYALRKS